MRTTMSRTRISLMAAVLVMGCLAGCATSKSYQAGVKDMYTVAADRMDRYAGADEALPVKIAELRSATADPVRYETASPAWKGIRQEYAEQVGTDPNLSEQRRIDWLETGRIIDRMNDREAARRLLFFLPP